jgi:hypothetical protein
MLGRALKMAFWVTYDHVGKLILANVIWFSAIFVPGLLVLPVALTSPTRIGLTIGLIGCGLLLGVALPVVTVGLAYMVKGLIDTRDGSVRDMFLGMRLYWRRAVAIWWALGFTFACLLTSARFYADKLREILAWVGYGISALALWGAFFVSLAALFALVALVQKRAEVLPTLKLSALVVLYNPLFCCGLAFQLLTFTVIAAVVPPVLVCLHASVSVVLISSGYEMLARKYAAVQARLAAGEIGSERGGLIAAMSTGGAAFMDDAQDEYLNRGFRDFLFPWKG